MLAHTRPAATAARALRVASAAARRAQSTVVPPTPPPKGPTPTPATPVKPVVVTPITAPPPHFQTEPEFKTDSGSDSNPNSGKKFSLAGFLFKLSLLTAAVYGTGAAAALIYEPLQEPYMEYLPGGETTLDNVDYAWKHRQEIKNFDYKSYIETKYAEMASSVNKSAEKAGLDDYVHLSHKKILPSNPHISQETRDKMQLQYDKRRERDADKYIVLSNSDPSAAASEDSQSSSPPPPPPPPPAPATPAKASTKKAAATPKKSPPAKARVIELPTITVSSSDAHVRSVVDSLNALIDQFNTSKISGETANIVDAININLAKLSQVFESHDVDALVNEKLESMKDTFEKEKTAIVQQLANTAEQTKRSLEEKHKQIIAREVEELRKTLELEYENKLKKNELELLESINASITSKIESERDGKLKDLKALSSRVESIEAFETQLSKVAESYTTFKDIRKCLSKINALLTTNISSEVRGSTLVEELAHLRELTKPLDNKLINATLDALPTEKELLLNGGVLTQSQIISRWELLVPELRSVALLPENPGVLGFVSSALFSKLIWSKQGVPVKTGDDYIGNDVESVVARVADYLHKNKLDDAVEEVTALKGVPRKIANDWIEDTRRKLQIQFLLDVLSTEVNVSA
jgi:mitofilin